MTPRLTDGTVVLDVLTPDDVDAITDAAQDPLIPRYTTLPSPYLREHAVGFVTDHAAGGWAAWAEQGNDCLRELTFAIRAEGRLAGVVGLKLEPVGSAEIGYWLAPWARGGGVLHRAVGLVLDWGFDAPDGPTLQRVAWAAVVGNWASWRAVWRWGFRFSGQRRLDLVARGERYDGWHAELLRDDPRAPAGSWPATTVEVDLTGLRP